MQRQQELEVPVEVVEVAALASNDLIGGGYECVVTLAQDLQLICYVGAKLSN